jgi:hypothetical protein
MQAGNSGFAVEGTVASDTVPYYLPVGAGFDSLTVTNLSVTENASVNNNLLVDGFIYGNIAPRRIQNNEEITMTSVTGGITLSASADAGTSVFRRFGLFDCLGSPTSPATLSTAPYNMPTSKGFFQGTVGDSAVYVFNVNPSFNPNPFAIIQTIDGSPTNVSGWSITGPGQITVTGPGGSQVAKFSIIIL